MKAWEGDTSRDVGDVVASDRTTASVSMDLHCPLELFLFVCGLPVWGDVMRFTAISAILIGCMAIAVGAFEIADAL